jgi:hypothetical protein
LTSPVPPRISPFSSTIEIVSSMWPSSFAWRRSRQPVANDASIASVDLDAAARPRP